MAGFLDELIGDTAGAAAPAAARSAAPAAKKSSGFLDELVDGPTDVSAVPAAPAPKVEEPFSLGSAASAVGSGAKQLLLGQDYQDEEAGKLPVYGQTALDPAYTLNPTRGAGLGIRAVVGALKKNEDKFRRLEETYGTGNVMLDPKDNGNFVIADPETGELFRYNQTFKPGETKGVMDFIAKRGMDVAGDVVSIVPELAGLPARGAGLILGAFGGGAAAGPVGAGLGAIAAQSAAGTLTENAVAEGIKRLDSVIQGRGGATMDTRTGGQIGVDLGREFGFGVAGGYAAPAIRAAIRAPGRFVDSLRAKMGDYTETAKNYMFGADPEYAMKNVGEYLSDVVAKEQAAGKLTGLSSAELAGLPEKRLVKSIAKGSSDQSLANQLDTSARVATDWADEGVDALATGGGRINPTALDQRIAADALAAERAVAADNAALTGGLREAVEGVPVNVTGLGSELRPIIDTPLNRVKPDTGLPSVRAAASETARPAYSDVALSRAVDNPLVDAMTTEEISALTPILASTARAGQDPRAALADALRPIAQRNPAYVDRTTGELLPNFYADVDSILATASRQTMPGEAAVDVLTGLRAAKQSPSVEAATDVFGNRIATETGIDIASDVFAPMDANAQRLAALRSSVPKETDTSSVVTRLAQSGDLRDRVGTIIDAYDPTQVLQRAGADITDPNLARSAAVVGAGGGMLDAQAAKEAAVLALRSTGGKSGLASSFKVGAESGPSTANAITEILSAPTLAKEVGAPLPTLTPRTIPEPPMGPTSGDLAAAAARQQAEQEAADLAAMAARRDAVRSTNAKLRPTIQRAADTLIEQNAPWLSPPKTILNLPRAELPQATVRPLGPVTPSPIEVNPFAPRDTLNASFPPTPPKTSSSPIDDFLTRIRNRPKLADAPAPAPAPAAAASPFDPIPMDRALTLRAAEPAIPAPGPTRQAFAPGTVESARSALADASQGFIDNSAAASLRPIEALTRAVDETAGISGVSASNDWAQKLWELSKGKVQSVMVNTAIKRRLGTGLGDNSPAAMLERAALNKRVGDAQRARAALRGESRLGDMISAREMLTRRGAEVAALRGVRTPYDTIARSPTGSALERAAEASGKALIRDYGGEGRQAQPARKVPF